VYAFSENYVLPLSHDEVVHEKGSLLARIPGDPWQQFANLRLLYAYQWLCPGKKLLFMGQEWAQGPEWDHDSGLCWDQREHPLHAGVEALVGELNRLYATEPSDGATWTRPDSPGWSATTARTA
jgi:1,4-alpha-glucan branching enzyme